MAGDQRTTVVRSLQREGLMLRRDIEAVVACRTVQRRLAQGELVLVNRRVVALPGTPLDLRTRTRAAVMALPDAIPTGPSALVMLGAGLGEAFDLGEWPWVVRRRAKGLQARFITHPGVRTVRAGGLRVAHPTDAVIDLLRFWPFPTALALAMRALTQGRISPEDLREANARLTRIAGRPQLERILREVARGTRSEAERALRDRLGRAGIEGWISSLEVRAGGHDYHVDFGFEDIRLAVEVDGRAFHSDPRSFQIDRERQNDLVAAGWTVLRFTWDDVVLRPDRTIARIREVLGALRAARAA